jgi:putative ABC transport system permease protein
MRPRLPSSLWKLPAEREVQEELEFHLEMRAREYVEAGLDPAAAREAALRKFADFEATVRDCRRIAEDRDRDDARREWWGELRQDAGFALRQMLRGPGFTALAAATLAVGIGATTAIFSVLHAVVLQPLPFADPDRLAVIATTWRGMPGDVSVGNYLYIAERQRSFNGLCAAHYRAMTLDDGGSTERVMGARVSHGFFPIFGIAPLRGRIFGPDEDAPGQDQVVVLSHRLWLRRFGGDPAALGRRVRISGVSREVIGIMPASFDATADSEELWVPIAFTPANRAMYDEHYLSVYGRLRPGLSLAQAGRDLARVARDLERDHPEENQERGARVSSLVDQVVGDYQGKVKVLLGAVSLVLLIACGNVANLLLGRGASRAKELALRGALGAGRARIVRQLVTESLLLAGLGGVLGVLVASAALQFLLATAPAGVPRLESARVDGLALAFAAGVAALSSLAFGLAPALASARVDLRNALNAGGRGATARGRDGRGVLVALEVAMALTLLAGAGLLVRTGLNLARVDLGFDAGGLVTAQVTLPRASYLGHERPARAFESMLEGLSRHPAIQAAALGAPAPLAGDGGSNGLIPEGRALDSTSAIDSDLQIVAPGYFGALRIPLRRGRAFDATDRREAPRVMVVNEELARAAFPGQDPIGRRISCCEQVPDGQAAWKEVVGVVANVRTRGPGAPVRPQFYLPLDQVPTEAWDWIGRSMTLVARSADFSAAATAVREAVRSVDRGVPVYDLVSMSERRRRATAQERFGASLLSALGGVGLGLACVGIYGVIAHFVSQRTREIAIRRALGASPREIVRLVVRQGLGPVLAGAVLGLGGALAAGRALTAILFGVHATDPLTLASVVALLLAAGMAACVFPARQALRVDPARALAEG